MLNLFKGSINTAQPLQGLHNTQSFRALALKNEECAKHYNDAQFSILATAKSSFHLSVLEALYINSLQPILCRQKKFVYLLQI